jgi:hypothetical protein
MWVLEVGHSLEVLLPHGILLIVDREERDQHVGGGGEAALTQYSESRVCHLLDGVVKLTAADGSLPQRRRVQGYLHPDLAHVQTMGLNGMAMGEGNIPIVAEANKCISQHT